eukprot:INCI16297.16.p1 GENE.INCI16297.16~~INCI16297.16.p1  ORF type:complete len:594 (+),score=116.95 INCI16297.16:1283-3064(+)
MKLVSRGDTTTVDAYLTPILRRYVDQVASELDGTQLMFMQSNGGLKAAHLFQGKDSILSGPAGGIVGAAVTCEAENFSRIIGFDMGGTSTDVAHYDGEFERTFNTEVAGVRMRAPMMRIHTVAAGGGSILTFDGARMRVGPASAGASPGPASYRRGGPLAVTDCNVLLGRLRPEFFGNIFGHKADETLDVDVVKDKFATLTEEINAANPLVQPLTPEQTAAGYLRIAVDNMATAIKDISVKRGHDITGYTLCCFGGAGGQHACQVADALGMESIMLHPFSGVLSAYGMGLANVRSMLEETIEVPLNEESLRSVVPEVQSRLEDGTVRELLEQDVPNHEIDVVLKAHIRYEGTDTALVVDLVPDSIEQTQRNFEAAHRQQYGFIVDHKALILEALGVEAVSRPGHDASNPSSIASFAPSPSNGKPATPEEVIDMFAGDQWHRTGVFDRQYLTVDSRIQGPAIIREFNSTTVVEPEWEASLTEMGALVLRRMVPQKKETAIGTDQADPITLEIFNNLFMSVAEQMGATLENVSHSVNIKERLDFSCALFDHKGQLIANAPHIPVHLGSMGDAIRNIISLRGDTCIPGDVFVTNAP